MDITFTEFIGKAPRLEAIQVTAENVEDLAVWMGADSYRVEKTLVGGERKVVFNKLIRRERANYPDRVEEIAHTRIGDWLVMVPDHVVAEHAQIYDVVRRFYSYTQEEIDRFVAQQHKTGEIDLNKE